MPARGPKYRPIVVRRATSMRFCNEGRERTFGVAHVPAATSAFDTHASATEMLY
jgi:hypothetical protein